LIDVILMRALPYGLLGALIGIAYVSALGWNVRLYVGHGVGWGALIVHALRLLIVAAAFIICARQGALPLLSSLVGFLVTRTLAVNQKRRMLEAES
jgi:F1F0 ATPase subunit 2